MYKRAIIILTNLSLVLLIGFTFRSVAQPSQTLSNFWTATYYPNTGFSGTGEGIYTYPTLNLNFGGGVPTTPAGDPVPNIPADHFSARFSSVQSLPAGNYIFTLTVDDQAVVRLNGVQIFNQITPATVAVQVALPGGNVTMEVEYIEHTDNAIIQLDWTLVGAGGPGQPPLLTPQATPTVTPTPRPTQTPLPPIPAGALTGTVIRAGVLNVRDTPTTGGGIIGKVLRGQTYQVLGRDQDARWFFIQLSGFQGWVNGYYIAFNRNEFTAPVVSGNTLLINPPSVPDYGVRAQAQAGLRMRGAPTTASEQTGRIEWGAFLPVIGRTADNQWWKIVWRETVGWIHAPFAVIVEGDIQRVPIE